MRRLWILTSCAVVAAICCFAGGRAEAGGWDTVHRYVHKTNRCGPHTEVLASMYSIGTRTASGEPLTRDALTAASHDYPLGTTVMVTNPVNGRTCGIRVNDRGPYGKSRQVGVKIDFATGAARCLGMRNTQYVCLHGNEAIEVAGVPQIVDGDTVEISGAKIRLRGIDAPEMDQLCFDAKGDRWSCGIAARDQLARRFGDKPWTCRVSGADEDGRSLGTCLVQSESVEEWMAGSGWALAFTRYTRNYEKPEAVAREARSGLWAGAFIPPWDWRSRTRETIVLGAVIVPTEAREILLGPAVVAEVPSPGCGAKGKADKRGKCRVTACRDCGRASAHPAPPR
ncbi:thermonuclease family protein [Rhodopseudomonas sp. HC1]|uniref:RlpA-like double-psi beta-barrel domain-containing protein n=1 Tax=Rhodopseudomonas infernalis TaxID=2897386 RepID=UPI001EE945EC|nr:RlpA-like double-psi beta-barrel domain-containing protein [Rhodopseudomonas infernalis]MCG6204248.1 thermonuclease family protein [Rhodopseudomonas infernalis]